MQLGLALAKGEVSATGCIIEVHEIKKKTKAFDATCRHIIERCSHLLQLELKSKVRGVNPSCLIMHQYGMSMRLIDITSDEDDFCNNGAEEVLLD